MAVACRLRGIKLGNFEFCPTPLQLGQLRGNAFRILMRDVNTHDEQHVSQLHAVNFTLIFHHQQTLSLSICCKDDSFGVVSDLGICLRG